MARLITPYLSLGTSALLGALAVLTGCSGNTDSGADAGARTGGVGKIVYAVRQHTVVEDGQVKQIDVAGAWVR